MESIRNKNILFITSVRITDPEEKGIYTDLIRRMRDEGINMFVVCPEERRYGGSTRIENKVGINFLYVKSFNIQKVGLLEKGLSTLSIGYILMRAIKIYFGNIKFDLIFYSTPPITLNTTISFLKKRDRATTYLLLKDIFPQNAVDLNLIKEGGFIHRYFQKIEKRLYLLSDYIGCMSEANKNYVLKYHSYLSPTRVEVNPNSIDLKWLNDMKPSSIEFRKKWGIKSEALICLYGGNIGKPQGIDFLIEILENYKNDPRIFFFVIGDGTEYNRVRKWFVETKPLYSKLINSLPKIEFDEIAKYGEAGLILLDKRFTIPNFPSRLLTYLENKMSIWAATDVSTDLGQVVRDNRFGFWVECGDLQTFKYEVERELSDNVLALERRKNGFEFLRAKYNIKNSFDLIAAHL